jgi:hypothetical protein
MIPVALTLMTSRGHHWTTGRRAAGIHNTPKMKIRSHLLSMLLIGTFALATANVSHAQIVNINARVSGAQPGLHQTFWLNPFNAVSLSLAAGTYDFTLVDPAIISGATFTAWTYNAPWITNYLVFDSTDLTHELFVGAVSGPALVTTAQAAFNATVAAGHNVTTFTLPTAETLLFTLPDNILGDNTGGVSIDVTPAVSEPPPPPQTGAVPEPSTYGLIGALALACLIFSRLNKRFGVIDTGVSIAA